MTNVFEDIGNFFLGLLGLTPAREPVSPGTAVPDLGKGLGPAPGIPAPAPTEFSPAPPQPSDPLTVRIDAALSHGAPFGIAQALAGAALDHDLSVDMLTRIARIESSFRPSARNDSDRPPSVGLMGVKSNTAAAVMNWSFSQAEIEDRLTDPRINLLVACKLLNSIKANRGQARASELTLVEMYHLGETRYLKGERDPGYIGRYNAA